MNHVIAFSIRKKIIEQRLSGKSLKLIAQDLNQSYSGVCRIWRRYQQRGEIGLHTAYHHCGRRGPTSQDLIYRAACWLKYLHRNWGADFIKQQLEQRYADQAIPHERTFQRWFKKRGFHRIIYRRLPLVKKNRAKRVHQVWQVDAKEQFKIQSGEPACYLNLTDEYSGGFINLQHFPPQPDQSGFFACGSTSTHQYF